MSVNPVDSDFNWVEARAACSLVPMFLRLRSGAEQDVETRNKQLGKPVFGITDLVSGKFAVFQHSESDHCVEFERMATEISARRLNGREMRATVTLSDSGSCHLLAGVVGEGAARMMDEWYFRKEAIEWLLFGA